ncbi:MAG: RsmB/NOP family class I SAM-dependent RNA methyltransferase [Lachnospiraceae bacterium]|nr:RsmB/NOP family class I SAM-dependent RNA methyltransferase [Lachnospiraceae bacterium]
MDISALPDSFLSRMQEMLGTEYRAFLESYSREHFSGLRVNTLKVSAGKFESLSPFELSKVRWIPNGYYFKNDITPAKHPFYYAGLYYIQEPSAMTPASLLPVKPGDKVLDLCAAPGGKTTELGAKLDGTGVLITNDISNSRAKALLKNVELSGIRNAVVISEPPEKLSERFEGYFDCILVDAPCSGEGMFRKQPNIIKNWEQYGSGYYADLQRQILPQAVKMLKEGGYMIYSTCTFSPLENEGSLAFILESFPQMHVVPIEKNEGCDYSGFEQAEPGYLKSGADCDEIGNALRLYPHRLDGEGHFVALLRKGSGEDTSIHSDDDRMPYISLQEIGKTSGLLKTAVCDRADNKCQNTDSTGDFPNDYSMVRKKYKQISDETFDFLEKLSMKVDAGRLWVKGDYVYLVPDGLPDLGGLRILRTGLLLGEMKKGRFEPSQALAMALKADEYPLRIELEPEGAEVIRYLKCETIDIPDDTPDGYVLACTAGFPLGWGKVNGGRFKNRYLPGWRMM